MADSDRWDRFLTALTQHQRKAAEDRRWLSRLGCYHVATQIEGMKHEIGDPRAPGDGMRHATAATDE